MTYSVTIDWLSFTVHTERGATDVLSLLNPSGIMEPATPRFGYTRAARTDENITVYSTDSSSRLGCHVVIPGSALLSLRERGIGADVLLQKVVAARAKVTRLDLAKDAQDEAFQLIQLSQELETGHWTGAAQKASTVKSSDGGMTCYIGSRQSERFIRVYNKGVESGQGGDWIRLELETKGETANLIAHGLADGASNLNDVLCGMARKMAWVPMPSWEALLSSDAEYSVPKIEKQSDREKWISEQVGQAIIDHLDHNPDSPAVRRLYELLRERLR
jgi:DNA relaxase NicK